MKRKKVRKPDRRIPVPKDGDKLIVLTGLVHVEVGRELAFCTAEQNCGGFFLAPADMGSPDGGKDLAARCESCTTKTGGELEAHWIVDFRTALFEGKVDFEDACYNATPLLLIENLIPARKAATS